MEPKIDQLWELDLDRKYVNVIVIRSITPSTHKIEVLCEVVEGPDTGQIFETDVGSFNNCNWRLLSQGDLSKPNDLEKISIIQNHLKVE